MKAAVVTLSDRGFRNEREDKSGELVQMMLKEAGYEVAEYRLLPDEQAQIETVLKELSDEKEMDLILTTGGTGFSQRDCTPEATLNVATRNAPGIAEAMRYASLAITPRAMLSRGASVIRNQTLIINLPVSTTSWYPFFARSVTSATTSSFALLLTLPLAYGIIQ